MTETEVNAFLEHHGVKGMKWGVRKSKSETGLSRRRAALIDADKRRIQTHKNVRDRKAGKVLNALSAPDKILMGEKRFKDFHNKNITALEKRTERVKSGELLMRDRLASNFGVAPVSVIFERKN